MSDERLREAERRWRETGAVEDEARYLLERVLAGDLPVDRVRLAGYLGHQAAKQAVFVEDALTPPKATPTDAHDWGAGVRAWATGLARWGDVLCVQVTAAAVRVAAEHCGALQGDLAFVLEALDGLQGQGHGRIGQLPVLRADLAARIEGKGVRPLTLVAFNLAEAAIGTEAPANSEERLMVAPNCASALENAVFAVLLHGVSGEVPPDYNSPGRVADALQRIVARTAAIMGHQLLHE